MVNRSTPPVMPAKPRLKTIASRSVEMESQVRAKKAQAYVAQLEPEPEEGEEEYAAYAIEDENGEEQVYLARIKDVTGTETRSSQEDRMREKCPTCGKTGHGAATCWLKMKCTECNGVGHPAEVCYRRCKFCDKVHDKKGPCPLKASVIELIQWAKTASTQSGKNLPALPEQLLNW